MPDASAPFLYQVRVGGLLPPPRRQSGAKPGRAAHGAGSYYSLALTANPRLKRFHPEYRRSVSAFIPSHRAMHRCPRAPPRPTMFSFEPHQSQAPRVARPGWLVGIEAVLSRGQCCQMNSHKQARIGSYIGQEGAGVVEDGHPSCVIFCHLCARTLRRPNLHSTMGCLYYVFSLRYGCHSVITNHPAFGGLFHGQLSIDHDTYILGYLKYVTSWRERSLFVLLFRLWHAFHLAALPVKNLHAFADEHVHRVLFKVPGPRYECIPAPRDAVHLNPSTVCAHSDISIVHQQTDSSTRFLSSGHFQGFKGIISPHSYTAARLP